MYVRHVQYVYKSVSRMYYDSTRYVSESQGRRWSRAVPECSWSSLMTLLDKVHALSWGTSGQVLLYNCGDIAYRLQATLMGSSRHQHFPMRFPDAVSSSMTGPESRFCNEVKDRWICTGVQYVQYMYYWIPSMYCGCTRYVRTYQWPSKFLECYLTASSKCMCTNLSYVSENTRGKI